MNTIESATNRYTHGNGMLAMLGRTEHDDALTVVHELVRIGRMFDDDTLVDYYNTHIDTMPALAHDTDNARAACARRVLVATAALIVNDVLETV